MPGQPAEGMSTGSGSALGSTRIRATNRDILAIPVEFSTAVWRIQLSYGDTERSPHTAGAILPRRGTLPLTFRVAFDTALAGTYDSRRRAVAAGASVPLAGDTLRPRPFSILQRTRSGAHEEEDPRGGR